MWISRRRLMISLVVGVMVSLAGFAYLGWSSTQAPVLVAAVDVDAHVPIDGEMVEVVHMPEDLVHPRALAAADMGIGSYSRRVIPAGTPVLADDLVDPGDTSSGLPWGLSAGKRGVAIPAGPRSAVGGAVEPGHLVDIIHFAEGSVHGGAVARTLLEEVRVHGVRDASGGTWREGDGSAPDTIIVAVSPRGAEVLSFAMATGSLYLASRPYIDDGSGGGGGVGAGNIYDYVRGGDDPWSGG